MREVTFRAGRNSATFLVEVEVSVAAEVTNSLCEEVQRWLNDEWAPRNHFWRRVCRNAGTEYIQNLLYSDEFDSPPRVLCGGSQLRFVIEGKKAGKLWKDWLIARLIPDVRARFPQIGEIQLIRNFEQV